MPTLILLRHGQSEWNLANRFTGWTDVPLTEQGIAEAVAGGALIAAEGLEPDVVHTSLLTRALQTTFWSLDAMARLWVPVHKTWRLNERHYGDLQGLDKVETTEKHGAEQVHIWRRSYATPPPPLKLDDERHPANDVRYAHLAPDAVPASESLSDVVARMLPYWYDAIAPDLLAGKRVLVSAHGNSLRALVKHLDDVSEDEIAGLNIPTGIPLVYRLDESLHPVSSAYLGDAAAAEAAAAAVAAQATLGVADSSNH